MLKERLKYLATVILCLTCIFMPGRSFANYVSVYNDVSGSRSHVGAITRSMVAYTSLLNVRKDIVNRKVELCLYSYEDMIREDVHFSFPQTKALIDILEKNLDGYVNLKNGDVIANVRGIDTSLKISKLDVFSKPYVLLEFHEDHPLENRRNYYCLISDHDSRKSYSRVIEDLKLALNDEGPKLKADISVLDYFIEFFQMNNHQPDPEALACLFEGYRDTKNEFQKKRFCDYVKPFILRRSRKLKEGGFFFVLINGRLEDYDFKHKQFTLAGEHRNSLFPVLKVYDKSSTNRKLVCKYPSINFNNKSDPYFNNDVSFNISFLNASEFTHLQVQPDQAEKILSSIGSTRILTLAIKMVPRKIVMGKTELGYPLTTIVAKIEKVELFHYGKTTSSSFIGAIEPDRK